jgi:hypothetical protein
MHDAPESRVGGVVRTNFSVAKKCIPSTDFALERQEIRSIE